MTQLSLIHLAEPARSTRRGLTRVASGGPADERPLFCALPPDGKALISDGLGVDGVSVGGAARMGGGG